MCVFTFGRDAIPLIPDLARVISVSEHASDAIIIRQSYASTRIEQIGEADFHNSFWHRVDLFKRILGVL